MTTRSVILVVPRQWERALIRAELLERGHDVVALRGLGDLLTFHAAAAGHAPIGVVLVDGRALTGRGHGLLSVVRGRKPDVAFLLLAEHGAPAKSSAAARDKGSSRRSDVKSVIMARARGIPATAPLRRSGL